MPRAGGADGVSGPADAAALGARAGIGAELRGVGVTVGGRRILDGVDLAVRPGELVALIGPNGAGKSTALGVLAGDTVPDDGSALIGGREAHRLRPAELSRLRAVLLQQKGVSFSYPVREVVAMGRMPWARTPQSDDDDAIVAEALEATGTSHLADRDVTTLSGGELARVSLARVLAQRCPIVLLDEPTDALDLGHQEQVLALATGLARAGGALLAVLHDLDLAAAYADRVVLLSGGRVVAEGTPEQVLTADLIGQVYAHPVDVIPHPSTGVPLVLPVRPPAVRRASGTLDR
ncbi:heme ABC transporter ATP-binding protein [Leifsonia sp. F6_8S_P_1B]|uniref:Heme ABC transporter ATP-binding protein n=1 Tax=Leifsonia williamsii TaxID=3035919 RepID=A0ABT8KB75_9MICO|nr:heme ABC transporter ATP-binding protein [Leifsonia williamsii]MDN4613742.1 heme ABC transporter ATP-binding protein [Leifsonia williamsii]